MDGHEHIYYSPVEILCWENLNLYGLIDRCTLHFSSCQSKGRKRSWRGGVQRDRCLASISIDLTLIRNACLDDIYAGFELKDINQTTDDPYLILYVLTFIRLPLFCSQPSGMHVRTKTFAKMVTFSLARKETSSYMDRIIMTKPVEFLYVFQHTSTTHQII